MADSEIPEVAVHISMGGRDAFDRYSEFRERYGLATSRGVETPVHLHSQPDGTVFVTLQPDIPELPPADLGFIAAEHAAPILSRIGRLPADVVARAELVVRGWETADYEARVRGYPPDIMRMWSAGYLRDA